jgi:prepilin-type N-terminal cleavage/methylation domain-containing protein
MRGRTRENGFTLVEVVVVIGVIAILAAILTPYITKYIEDSKTAKAKNEAQVIGAAVAIFYKDVARWPNWVNAQTSVVTYGGLYTGGTAPAAALFSATGTGWAAIGAANWNQLDTHLITNGVAAPNHNYVAAGELRWNGPYATSLPLDPWGRPYIINSAQFVQAAGSNIPAWVMSAGTNGTIDTPVAAATTTPTGDDVGFRIR